MPGIAVVVLVGGIIFVAPHCLATVPGIAVVVVTSPPMELVVAFPRVVVNFSLFPESSDLSWSSGIVGGGRHGEQIGVLSGVEGVG